MKRLLMFCMLAASARADYTYQLIQEDCYTVGGNCIVNTDIAFSLPTFQVSGDIPGDMLVPGSYEWGTQNPAYAITDFVFSGTSFCSTDFVSLYGVAHPVTYSLPCFNWIDASFNQVGVDGFLFSAPGTYSRLDFTQPASTWGGPGFSQITTWSIVDPISTPELPLWLFLLAGLFLLMFWGMR